MNIEHFCENCGGKLPAEDEPCDICQPPKQTPVFTRESALTDFENFVYGGPTEHSRHFGRRLTGFHGGCC